MSTRTSGTTKQNNNEISSITILSYNIIILLTLILHTAIIIGVIYALMIPTLINDPSQTFPGGRQFKTSSAVPFGNDHRNEFGNWYGILLAFHSIFGWILGLFIIIAAFPNIFGGINGGNSKLHKIIGIISILLTIITICAAVPMEISLITSRGYLACQWKDYSFSVFISIHFTQWFIWIMELLNYGIISLIYKDNDNNNNNNKIPNIYKYYLKYLSICTIIFNIWKCGMWFIIYFNPNSINCMPFWRPWFNVIVNLFEIPTIKYSIYNIRYIGNINIHRINTRLLSILVIITIAANIVYKLGGNDNAMCGYLYLSVFLISLPILYFIDLKLDFLNGETIKIKSV